MSLATAGGVNTLHLFGGDNHDWSKGLLSMTGKVWQILFSSDSHSYNWMEFDSDMGKCGVWCRHVVIIIFIRYEDGKCGV